MQVLMALLITASGFGPGPAHKDLTVTIKPEKDRVALKQPFRVCLRVANSSRMVQSFRVMNCSWDQHWESSSRAVTWVGWDCPKNFPVTVKLEPGQAYQKALSMLVLAGEPGKKVSFKMGFTPYDSQHTYWSNECSVEVSRRAAASGRAAALERIQVDAVDSSGQPP